MINPQILTKFASQLEGELHFDTVMRTLYATDASAYHNLGTVHLRLRHFSDAAAALAKAIELRPDFAPTYMNLGYALKESGDHQAALKAFNNALRIDPKNETASEEQHVARAQNQNSTRESTLHESATADIFDFHAISFAAWWMAARIRW